MNEALISEAMLEAGIETLLEQLPIEVFNERSIDPAELVVTMFQAMSRKEWLPIRTAPQTGMSVMLAVVGPTAAEAKVGIGMWADDGDDSGSGRWSTEAWWGKPPTHWRPMPRAPQPPEEAAKPAAAPAASDAVA
jgi:hypothetical protein